MAYFKHLPDILYQSPLSHKNSSGDYINIKSTHYTNDISGNGPVKNNDAIDIPLKVKSINDGSILLDIEDQPNIKSDDTNTPKVRGRK